MEKKKISWTPAEKKVYDLICSDKESKRLLIRCCAQYCSLHRLYTFHSTTGWQREVYDRYHDTNPNYGDALLAIGRGLHKSGLARELLFGKGISTRNWLGGLSDTEMADFIEKLFDRFWEVICSRNEKLKPKDKMVNTNTQDIQELLAREFIHKGDFKDTGEAMGGNSDYQLVWPVAFTSEEEGASFLANWSIGNNYLTLIK